MPKATDNEKNEKKELANFEGNIGPLDITDSGIINYKKPIHLTNDGYRLVTIPHWGDTVVGPSILGVPNLHKKNPFSKKGGKRKTKKHIKNKKTKPKNKTKKTKPKKNKTRKKHMAGRSPDNLPSSPLPPPLVIDEDNTDGWSWNEGTNGFIRIPQNQNNTYNIIQDVNNNNIDRARMAILHGNDVNTYYFGHGHQLTPLMIAVHNQNIDMVMFLLSVGADRLLVDINGHTPLDISRMLNNQVIENILITYHSDDRRYPSNFQ